MNPEVKYYHVIYDDDNVVLKVGPNGSGCIKWLEPNASRMFHDALHGKWIPISKDTVQGWMYSNVIHNGLIHKVQEITKEDLFILCL